MLFALSSLCFGCAYIHVRERALFTASRFLHFSATRTATMVFRTLSALLILVPLVYGATTDSESSSVATLLSSVSSSSVVSSSSSVSTYPTSIPSTDYSNSASSSSSLLPASSSTATTQTFPNTPFTSHYTFSPFPTPTQLPVPGVFPATDPSDPPPVDAGLIPDFAPAWAIAYAKAKSKVCTAFFLTMRFLYFFHVCHFM